MWLNCQHNKQDCNEDLEILCLDLATHLTVSQLYILRYNIWTWRILQLRNIFHVILVIIANETNHNIKYSEHKKATKKTPNMISVVVKWFIAKDVISQKQCEYLSFSHL